MRSINEIIKSSNFINKIYYYIGSIVIKFIKLFVKTQDDLILFISFGGKQYNDSPKAIYETMLKDPRFKNCDFVWAVRNPHKFNIPGKAKIIRIDTVRYFLTSLKARVWISNSPIERRLNYRGKNTFYFCTWHGTPIKKLGHEISSVYARSKYDVICAQGKFDVKVFEQAFNIKKENILLCGLPRNDVLATAKKDDQINFKRILNIPSYKKVILYCPTYRDWKDNYMSDGVNFTKWKQVLGESYIVLFRAHSKVVDEININEVSDFVFDVSDYHDLNDLMIASDILITDYSSISFDYSILEKPILLYTYDYEEYALKRGVYFDIREELPGGSISEDELLNLILNMPYKKAIQMVKAFKDKYVEYYGEATSKSLDVIHTNIQT